MNYQEFSTLQAYIDAVLEMISTIEDSSSQVENIGDGKATIGYGYTFSRSNNVAIWTASGITLSSSDLAVLQAIDNAEPSQRTQLALTTFTRTLTDAEAKELLRHTYTEYETIATNLGMPLSLERVALVSITYNRGISNVNRKMQEFITAVEAGDRAEAWFQIRYNAKSTNYPGAIAKRRYYESEIFGLYDEGINSSNISLEQATDVYKMFTKHRQAILDYESNFGVNPDGTTATRNRIFEANRDYGLTSQTGVNNRVDTLEESFKIAYEKIVKDYITDPQEIDVQASSIKFEDVLIMPNGQNHINTDNYFEIGDNNLIIGGEYNDTVYAGVGDDVVYGEKGNDTLHGDAGDDHLLGGEGHDLLYGGDNDDTLYGGDGIDRLNGDSGDDYLNGGAGNDILNGGIGNNTYDIESRGINSAASGIDTIYDSDGAGQVIYDFQTLNGGKQIHENTFESADGSLLYHYLPDGKGRGYLVVDTPDGKILGKRGQIYFLAQ